MATLTKSTNDVFSELNDLPEMSFTWGPPLHYYDESNNKKYLFFIMDSNWNDGSGGIWKFDINEKSIEKYPYPEGYTDRTGRLSVIDVKNTIIYINYLRKTISFNFKTKEWDFSIFESYGYFLPQDMVMIPSPINELHAIESNDHHR